MRINNSELTQIIECCFALSMDGRVDSDVRKDFLTLGKKLRGLLLNLLTAQFTGDTQAVKDANSKIEAINSQLKKTAEDLQKTAQVVQQLGELVSILDDVLGIAGSFV